MRQLQLDERDDSSVLVVEAIALVEVAMLVAVAVTNKVLVIDAGVGVAAPLVTEVVVCSGLDVVVVTAALCCGTLPTMCHPNFPLNSLAKLMVDPGMLEDTEKRFQYVKVPLPVPLTTVSASLPTRFAMPM